MLNNKGMALDKMLFYMAFLLVAVLVILFMTYYISNSFKPLENAFDTEAYENLESEMNIAAKKYYVNKHDKQSYIKVDLDTLIDNGYLTKLIRDLETNKRCRGYTEITVNDSDNIIANSFLKCDNYTTKGYRE